MKLQECEKLCLQNCTCTAYANADATRGGHGCLLWFDDLIDISDYAEDGEDIYVKMPSSELGKSNFTINLCLHFLFNSLLYENTYSFFCFAIN